MALWSKWFLQSKDYDTTETSNHDEQVLQEYDLIDYDCDKEIRPTLTVKALYFEEPSIGTERFTKD